MAVAPVEVYTPVSVRATVCNGSQAKSIYDFGIAKSRHRLHSGQKMPFFVANNKPPFWQGCDRESPYFVGFIHDHRNFGDSGGEPRQDIDPWRQIEDWRRAISYLESLNYLDSRRIGIWGTSYSGGHAIVLGATDRRLKAVVTQVPTIDGFASGQRRVNSGALPALEEAFNEDQRAVPQPCVAPTAAITPNAAPQPNKGLERR
jgi:hypothetical protein